MGANVTAYTIIDRLKKKQQIAFRRLMSGQAPSSKIREYVGLSFMEIKAWINKRMLPGMTWNNYGSEWVIDHVVPLRLFDLSKESDCKMVWNYRNLMPLFKEDNLHKEGDLRFSILLLQKMEPCFIVNSLIDIIEDELKKMDKYLGTDNNA